MEKGPAQNISISISTYPAVGLFFALAVGPLACARACCHVAVASRAPLKRIAANHVLFNRPRAPNLCVQVTKDFGGASGAALFLRRCHGVAWVRVGGVRVVLLDDAWAACTGVGERMSA